MNKSSPTLTTGGLSTILIALIQKFVKDAEIANVLIMFSPIFSAIFVYFIVRLLSKFFKPIPMLKMQHSLERERKAIKKELKNKNINQSTRDLLIEKYNQAGIDLIDLEKNFRQGKFVIDTTSIEN